MKKLFVLFSAITLVFCFASCKSSCECQKAEEVPAVEEVAAPAPVVEETKALEVFPEGKWLDANWNALWVFSVDGKVKLLDSNTGDLIYDFDGKTTDSKIEKAGLGLKYSFRCDDTKRFYAFTKDLEGTDLQMDIDRDWTDEPYSIVMPLQK